ncbi:protein unzipped [Fopius arisanus]|uniref:Protein unzipped n=1 Tax=Fopius arisanus TaxID=64838 RepID=A0A9R1TMP7_9HYME|nr:PREDICTED: protein unzipped [Fopius arisanus]
MDWKKCSWINYVSLTLLSVLAAIPESKSDNSVHIFSTYRLPVTSSILNWLPISHYDSSKNNTLVIGGFQISKSTDENYNEGPSEQREMYVCRAAQSGVWVAGAQLKGEKKCTVTVLGIVQAVENYELLENVDNAARLSWVSWSKFYPIPTGAVVTETMYVARYPVTRNETDKDTLTPTYTHYIGTLNHDEKLGTIAYVKSDGQQGSTNAGELLVETEPIYYELTSVKLNHWRTRIIKSESKIIGQATISNSGTEGAKLVEKSAYGYKYSSYWGQGHAMIKALNTSITLFNRTKLPTIKWGMEERSERMDSYSLEIYLEPGTGVNVKVKANYTEYEVPYTGQLVSHYEDGESKSREISGMRREETITDLRSEFGPIYFLSNSSIVPTTVKPPTTRGATTFSSSSTNSISGTLLISSTSTNKQNDINNVMDSSEDGNSIIPPRHDSNMQSDDGGPQSLKNKDALGAATSSLPSLYISIALILVTLYRIT